MYSYMYHFNELLLEDNLIRNLGIHMIHMILNIHQLCDIHMYQVNTNDLK